MQKIKNEPLIMDILAAASLWFDVQHSINSLIMSTVINSFLHNSCNGVTPSVSFDKTDFAFNTCLIFSQVTSGLFTTPKMSFMVVVMSQDYNSLKNKQASNLKTFECI